MTNTGSPFLLPLWMILNFECHNPLVIVVMEFVKVMSKIDSVKEILNPNESKQQIK